MQDDDSWRAVVAVRPSSVLAMWDDDSWRQRGGCHLGDKCPPCRTKL